MKGFFYCEICGNLVGQIKDGGGALVCCGTDMVELKANAVDAAQEKHIPVFSVDGKNIDVKVGSAAHPMEADHSIEWVYIATKDGAQRKALSPGMEPETSFALSDGDELVAVYAYCDKHGLWGAQV